jgi:exonuclease SbcD
MRIVHTSDWHLGRQFGPYPMHDDQERFVDWFVAMVEAQRADLVVIAGDIYDRSIAPVESIELFRDAVRRLRATGAAVAVISGNHDGPDRLSPYGDLGDSSGLLIRGGYAGVGGVTRLELADGPLDLVLLPFLEPAAAPDAFGDPTDVPGDRVDLVERRRRRTHESVLASAIAVARPLLSAPRSVAVAHAFVAGGGTSDSERQLVVGGTGEVAASLFDGFSYTALGHLHRPQEVGGPTVRYSGTPLAYSFSEDHPKSVNVVELDPDGTCRVELVPVDVGRAVCTLRGTMAELLDPARHPGARDRFVRAIVTDRETVLDARSRLGTVYPLLAEVRLAPEGLDLGALTTVGAATRELDPLEATRQFWAEVEGAAPPDEIDALLVDALRTAVERSRP